MYPVHLFSREGSQLMAPARLILIKHAMPVIVPDAPPRTWVLSDAGRDASARLVTELAVYEPVAVVTSVEPKAAETGAIIAAGLGLPSTAVTGLHEHERDVVPFDSTERFHERMRHFFAEPAAVVYGTESAEAAHARFATAIRDVLAAHPSGSLIVVAHGTVISLLVARANGIEPFPFWAGLDLPSFVVVERDSFVLAATD
jgi:broad specificity phosphatase PhoE